MFRRRAAIFLELILIFFAGSLIFVREGPVFGSEDDKISALIGRRHFDFLVWEADAFLTKAEPMLTNGHSFLTEADRKQIVLDYLDLLRQAQQLDAQITQAYVDPEVTDPDQETADLQTDLNHLRAEIEEIQPLAEAIVQEQVGTILTEEGFGILGQTWPPVMMHMSPLPSILIASPRDRIERVQQRPLVTGLTTPEMEVLETAVSDNLDLSALVVPIGGLGTYPAMIQETTNMGWLAEVTAHEWSHHWLSFYPVGFNYSAPQVRTINETIASIIDVEIREKVIARYYPELVPPPPPPAVEAETEPTPPPFDFRAEMAETRVQVDEMLAEGRIEEAETYMEERRRLFVENGYGIRKLNQAYFAFYGAYASQPGATGSDPTGPMLRDIREHSDSLRAFMDTVASIASFEDLERIWQETTAD